jgi:Na+/melibiose symporter-like transporter
LVAAATTNPKSRGSIISYRMSGSTVTSIILGATTLPLIFYFGGTSDHMTSKGVFWVAFLSFLIAFPFGFMAFFQVRERVAIPVSKHKLSYSWRALKGNWPFWIFFVAFLIYGWSMASGTVRMYYWQYLAHNFIGMVPNQTLWGIGMAIGAVSYNFIVKGLNNKGKAPAIALASSGVANGILALFMLSAESSSTTILAYHVMTLIQSIANGVAITSMYGVMPDITEYTQWKYRIRISGFITSILNCSFKFGFAFGMAAFTAMLSLTGYVPNAENTDLVKQIINLNMHWLPCAVLIIAGLVMLRYKISNDEYYKMLHEIAERNDTE